MLAGTRQWLLSDTILRLHGILVPGREQARVSCLDSDPTPADGWLHSQLDRDRRRLQEFETGHCPPPVIFYCSKDSAEPERSDLNMILTSLSRQLSYLGLGSDF